jgi:hypothetical protein
MAAPNLIGAVTIVGKTTAANLTTTNETAVISNAGSSGKCFKINTLNVANFSASVTQVSVLYHTGAGLAGTATFIAGNITIPAYSTLNVIDRGSQYYLEEGTSIGAQASSANALGVTVSYEDIS